MLERVHPEIADAAVHRLLSRSTSIFARLGEHECRRYVSMALAALEVDLASGKLDAIGAAMQTLVEELLVRQLRFADLCFYAQTLRASLRSSLESASEAEGLRQVDDWSFELLRVCALRFVAQRETVLEERTAEVEVQRLESQLEELQAALAEKTRLLEMIRQASTPIAPVVQGILVVPLVGTFDTVRAENLTEKLLREVARVHARAAILDVSGVPVFDATAARLTIRLARAVRLLGTEVFLVGLSPNMAQTIVELGIDLGGLGTLATLQDGLARALSLQRLKIAPA